MQPSCLHSAVKEMMETPSRLLSVKGGVGVGIVYMFVRWGWGAAESAFSWWLCIRRWAAGAGRGQPVSCALERICLRATS